MPRYDYQCNTCNNIQEEIHPFSGPTKRVICEKCKSNSLKKIISTPYIKFIGDWQTNTDRKI
jgi:putative FmdB family regulatory protein